MSRSLHNSSTAATVAAQIDRTLIVAGQPQHAVYAVAHVGRDRRGLGRGQTVAFRVGQPVDREAAQKRWTRLDDRRRAGRRPFVRWSRRKYVVAFFEVRAVDYHGRGLGSQRHSDAFPVPYRALGCAK